MQVLAVNDVVGSALSLPDIRTIDRQIHVAVPADVLVETNTIFELTLLNILGNAINFSDFGSAPKIGRNLSLGLSIAAAALTHCAGSGSPLSSRGHSSNSPTDRAIRSTTYRTP